MLRLVGPKATQHPALSAPRGSGVVTTLEVLTVAACLALGAAFVGTLLARPPAPDATVRVCRVCPPNSPSPC